MTTNLWTVGQGLVTRRLVPKPGSPARCARRPETDVAQSAQGGDRRSPTARKAAATTPKPPPAQPRRVKKKGRAKR